MGLLAKGMRLLVWMVMGRNVCGCDSQAHSSMMLSVGAEAAQRAKWAFKYRPIRMVRVPAQRAKWAYKHKPIRLGRVWKPAAKGYPTRIRGSRTVSSLRWPANITTHAWDMGVRVGKGPVEMALSPIRVCSESIPMGRQQSNKGNTWGRTLAVWMFLTWVGQSIRGRRAAETGVGPAKSGFVAMHLGETGCHIPTLRAGGGVSNVNVHKRDQFARNQADLIPVALKEWGNWYGTDASKCANRKVEESIGGSVASSTRRNYEGRFRKWEVFRGVNGKGPYIDQGEDRSSEEEDSVLSYVALSVGPLGKEVSTMVTHLSAIGFFHRIKYGTNPLNHMSRVQLMLKGLKRAQGPTKRKLPITVEDLRALKGLLNLSDPDQLCLWTTILTGWFFMLRMSEFLVTNSKHAPPGRHPLHMDDVQPLCEGRPTHWGAHVDEISVHISGSKTDRMNQGCVRSHTRVGPESPNADICVVSAFVMLFSEFPAKFSKRTHTPIATWRNGMAIPAEEVTALLRAAAASSGNSPGAYSLHSLRSGGATALYQATHDIDLVARFGRWKSKCISVYLWGSHQFYSGLGTAMVTGGHVLHQATRGLKPDRPHEGSVPGKSL